MPDWRRSAGRGGTARREATFDNANRSAARKLDIDRPTHGDVASGRDEAVALDQLGGGVDRERLHDAGLTRGTFRVVPPSVIVAGISSYNDAQGMSPNVPAAGDNGVSRTALGLTQTVLDADHQTLNAAGVNVIRSRWNSIRVMGWRTTSSEPSDPRWINLGNARMFCFISNRGALIGERFLFREIDGRQRTVSEWGAALGGEIMMPLFLAGSLYTETGRPADAFRVDLDENTPATAQNRQLLADIVYVDAQFGEEININLIKQLITEGVS